MKILFVNADDTSRHVSSANAAIYPKYRPIHQLPYCCVPATLQWIFYRRNLDIYDQVMIGSELGLRVPERFLKYFDDERVRSFSCEAKEYGTQILKEEYSIGSFFC